MIRWVGIPSIFRRRKSLSFAKKPSAEIKSGADKNLEADFDIKAAANDRALKTLGVRELNLGHLPLGAEIINLPDQVCVCVCMCEL